MKTHKLLLVPAFVMAALCMGSANGTETEKKDAKNESKEVMLQCGVTNSQIYNYLVNCSHHHTVGDITDIPGTCNSNALIENCKTATVYVSDGQIIGHTDSQGLCGE